MSPLGQHISNWLASGPGLISADTLEALWASAHWASGLHHSVPLVDFQAALDRSGYRPRQRTVFNSEGKPSGAVFVLALPERAMGL